MWSKNAFTRRLNLKWPILQAPMGELTTPSLASAVSNAGGLGGLGMWGFTADDARRRIEGFRQLSSGSLNVNYPLWEDPGDLTGLAAEMRSRLQAIYTEKGLGPLPVASAGPGVLSDEHLEMLLQMKPEVVSFNFGLPDAAVVAALRAAGVFVLCSATTVAEARILHSCGVDAVIAQGTEAGGHRGTFTDTPISMQPGLFSLLPQVVDAVDVPVVAAGGIADGRGVAAALMLGASGVQVGTAFLRCEQANVRDAHRCAVETGDDACSVISEVISGRPARYIKNRLIEKLSGAEPLPFPAQFAWTGPLEATGEVAMSALFAGQSVALSRALGAGELVETLAAETSDCLRAFQAI